MTLLTDVEYITRYNFPTTHLSFDKKISAFLISPMKFYFLSTVEFFAAGLLDGSSGVFLLFHF